MTALNPNLAMSPMFPATAARPEAPGHPVRVLTLLPVLWALNLLDLLFTLLAETMRGFVELNPLAVAVGPSGQVIMKLSVLVLCTVVFVTLRHKRCVEWGCYLLLGVYGVLGAVWLTSFHFLLSPIFLRRLAGLF